VRLFPTRSALDVAVAGAAVVLAGILLFQPAIVAWGGALIVGLSVGRAITLLNVARVRSAGFEMVWRGSGRSLRIQRGQQATIFAEVRNRDTRAARYVQLRVIGSANVAIELEPDAGEVPAGGRLEVEVKVTPKRVGRHGLFGLGLELRGSPGLFEVPLTFSNPFGLEVLPARPALGRHSPLASGGMLVGVGSARRSGDSTEFSEIREYQAGDPLKRVAWKASARRGKLLVRKYEVEERDVVWFVLDAAVELWAGRVGHAPLDLAIDGVAQLLRQHLRAGHEVGFVSVAGSVLERIAARRGSAHERRLLEALARTPLTLEPERSGLDERGVALRVLEHLRSLVPVDALALEANDIERIAGLARRVMPQAPFPDARVNAPTPRESVLRTHLAAFGISAPPRLEARHPSIDAALAEAVLSVTRGRKGASVVYLASPMPDEERWKELWPRLRQVPRHRTSVCWVHAPDLPALDTEAHLQSVVARTAARLRSESDRFLAEQRLRHVGIRAIACAGGELAPAHEPETSSGRVREDATGSTRAAE
jgi:uncharacterized protein (DUF58 family)